MAHKPLILFDLIATITDAGPRYAKAYRDVAKRYGIKIPTEKSILNELGQNHLKGIITKHSPDLPEHQVNAFINDCNQTCDSMLNDNGWIEHLYPNVESALQNLKQMDCVLGIYTGTRSDAAIAQLRYHNIEHYFDPEFIQAKDSTNSHYKESALLKSEQIEKIITAYLKKNELDKNVALQSIIIIGDTLSDYEAATQKNLPFIGFANNARKAFSFAKAGVTDTFESYDKALEKISSSLGVNLPISPISVQHNERAYQSPC